MYFKSKLLFMKQCVWQGNWPVTSFGGVKMISVVLAVSDLPCRIHMHSESVNVRSSTSHWPTLSSFVSSSLHTHTHTHTHADSELFNQFILSMIVILPHHMPDSFFGNDSSKYHQWQNELCRCKWQQQL